MSKWVITPGDRFGRLVVVSEVANDKGGRRRVLCACECGVEKVLWLCGLTSGEIKSCGCLNRDYHTKHGMYATPEYRSWQSMKARCLNPNHVAYENYGARGIQVCVEWVDSFEAFFHDMGCRPSGGYSLDRIDNEVGYEPNNCRWATTTEQRRNCRTNKVLTVGGVSRCLTEWAEIKGLKPSTLRERLKSGWPIEEAVLTPAAPHRSPHTSGSHGSGGRTG